MSTEETVHSVGRRPHRKQRTFKPCLARHSARLQRNRQFLSQPSTFLLGVLDSKFPLPSNDHITSNCSLTEGNSSMEEMPTKPEVSISNPDTPPYERTAEMSSTNKLSTDLKSLQKHDMEGSPKSKPENELLDALKKQMETNNDALKIMLNNSMSKNSAKLRHELKTDMNSLFDQHKKDWLM